MTVLINNWWKPQLSTTGAGHKDLPEASTAGSVLRPRTTLSFSIRLPPTKSTKEAETILKERLTTNIPYGAKATLDVAANAAGWVIPPHSAFLTEIINSSAQEVFGKPKFCAGEGGSIPLMNLFHDMYPKAEFIVTGVLGPASNAHGPNEFLHIPYVKNLTTCMSLILAKISHHLESKK